MNTQDADQQKWWSREDGFTLCTCKELLDIDVIHRYLSQESYWAQGIARELVQASIENSTICYGIYKGDPRQGPAEQIGFARVVSDLVRFAWLADVFVLPAYRGIGLSKWMIGEIVEHPKLKGVGFLLSTSDAHTLYSRFGFEPLDMIERRMGRPLDWKTINRGYGLL